MELAEEDTTGIGEHALSAGMRIAYESIFGGNSQVVVAEANFSVALVH